MRAGLDGQCWAAPRTRKLASLGDRHRAALVHTFPFLQWPPGTARRSARLTTTARRLGIRCFLTRRRSTDTSDAGARGPRRGSPPASSAGLPGAALVEPVRGRQLLGQEPGHRRVASAAAGPTARRPADSTAAGRDGQRGPGRAAAAAARRRRRRITEDLADRPGLAVGDHERLAVHLGARSSAATSASAALSTYVVSTSAAPCRAAAAGRRRPRSTIRRDELGVAGPPDDVRPDGDAPPGSAPSAGQREPFGQRLGPGVRARGRARGSAGPAPAPTSDGRRGRPTARTPGPAGRRRAPAGGEHGPGADDVGPHVVGPGPGDVDLGGEVDDGVLAVGGPARPPVGVGDVAASTSRQRRARTAGAASRSPRRRGRRAPGRRRRRASAGPGDQDPHGRPGRRRPAPARPRRRAARGRSWSCAGCRRAARGRPARPPPATPRRRARRRPAAARPAGGSSGRPASWTQRGTTTTATTCWVPAGPTPTTAAADDPVDALDPLLHRRPG